MKYAFSFLMMLIAAKGFSQEIKLSVFIRDEAINVTPGDENKNKILTLNTKQFSNDDVLTIHINSDAIDKDWKRKFFIYDKEDNSISDFTVRNDGNFVVKFETLKTVLHPQQTYFIYTSAMPADPQKAMMIKVGRQLVCAVKIL